MSGVALAKASERAYKAALRLSRGNSTDAEDAAQEAVLRFLDRKPEYKGEAALRGWFSLVGANIQRDRFRRKYDHEPKDRVYSREVDRFGPMDRPIREREMAEAVDAALAKLPPAFQDVIRLRFAEDATYREIAATLGVPVGTVMSRLFRSMRLLRSYLSSWKDDV